MARPARTGKAGAVCHPRLRVVAEGRDNGRQGGHGRGDRDRGDRDRDDVRGRDDRWATPAATTIGTTATGAAERSPRRCRR